MVESSADPLLDSLINDFGANYVFALDLLEQCLPKLGHEKVQWAKYDSDFDPVRNHPRYQRLFERIDKVKALKS